MTFTGKMTFNINGTTIYFALNIPINQSLSKMRGYSTKVYLEVLMELL